MGTLFSTLKADQLQARKAKNTTEAALLTTLIGEAAMPGKNDGNRESTDAEVMGVIRKFIKGANDTISVIDARSEMVKTLHVELEILNRYMPKQMIEEELRSAIMQIADDIKAESAKDMGRVMKELQTRHSGLYDGKSASSLVRVVLEAKHI